jgi:hypothetical protein
MAAMAESPPAARTHRKFDPAQLILGIACAVGLVSTGVILALMPVNRHFASSRDFIVYWATGQQLAHHGNPFDAQAMGATERRGGFDRTGSFYMRNPPWSLPLTVPLGYVGARVASLPWSLLLAALLVLSVRLLRPMLGLAGTPLEWLGYCFPPALQCILMGQTSLFLLLGLVLFLRFHRSRPFWSGSALWFCTLKPHLFVPFGLVLLVWIASGRRWRILAGAAAAMVVSCGLITGIDPAVWSQYAHWAQTSGISHESIPCLGVTLRNLIDPAANWLVFVPCALGSVWALVYFWPRRHAWDWMEHGALVVLVSLLVAPYCWVLDQSLALPALLYAAVRTRSQATLATLGVLFLVLELQPMFLPAGLNSAWYLWPAPAWLAWYLWARRSAAVQPLAPTPAAA